MHILQPPFEMDRTDALRFAAARGFGTIIASDDRGPRGSHVPFTLQQGADGSCVVKLHLTARNPLIPLADGTRRFLLVVSGPDSYISNDWYVSPDQVSTWLYQAVHLSGVAHLRDFDDNRPHGDQLLAEAEARLPKQPWSLAGMEPVKREAMLRAIRVIDIVVDQVEGQSKLNQLKGDADHVAVANRLAAADNSASRDLAMKMRALRPHLAYEFP